VTYDDRNCAPSRRRYVLKPDSTYEIRSGRKSGCGQALAIPDTSESVGRYEITGDSLSAMAVKN
jgi:hypothetical protein